MPETQPTGLDNALRYDSPREELSAFVPATARRVLDVGCGAGGFGRTLRQLLPLAQLWGVEPVPEAAEVARGIYDEVVTTAFPSSDRSLDGLTFDAVFMLDVLEHMIDPEEALRAARPLVAPGGLLVASIPNVRHFAVWWPLVAHGTWTYTETGLMDRTHLRWFTRSSIHGLFTSTGWEVLDLQGINRTRSLGWKAKLMSLLGRRAEDLFFVQYAVTARPDERDA